MPFYVSNPERYIGEEYVYSGTGRTECAYFCQLQAEPSMGRASGWRPGAKLGDSPICLADHNLRKGVVIATFNSNGRYPQGDDQDSQFDAPHAAIFIKYVATGIQVIHQPRDNPVGYGELSWGGESRYYDLTRYHIVENLFSWTLPKETLRPYYLA